MKWKMKFRMFPAVMLTASAIVAHNALPSRAEQIVAWSAQSGPGKTYTVLFNGKIFTNRWWVESYHCPADASPTNANNAWEYQRDATADELKNLDNPNNCDAASSTPGSGGSGADGDRGNFDIDHAYSAGDIVAYDGQEYKARWETDGIFVPGEQSVWKLWVKTVPWQNNQVYKKGQHVIYHGSVYMAQWWTRNEVPTEHIGNGTNGQVWLPKDDYIELNTDAVQPFQPYATYLKNDAIKFKNKIYIAKRDIKREGESPVISNPWTVYINWSGVSDKVGESPGPWPKHFFAPYIDASLGYVPDMAEFARDTGTDHFTLAFLVNSDSKTCSYGWGGVSPVKDGPSGLYSNIKALRRAGGDVMVSIGGANNNPLAKVCTNVEELKTQYKNIIDNLNLSVLDFDIEGGHVADRAAIKRRSQALKMLQDEFTLEGRTVPIWITLPVLPTGLTADGVNVIRSAMSHGVKLAGVNLMTMDYGGSMGCQSINRQHKKTGVSNSKCDIDATKSVHGQLRQLADEFNLELSDSDIWSMLGATPMLGVNDQDLEVFYPYDAQNLRSHAESKGLGMLSMWSVARDRSAPSGQAWQVSPSHSGLTAHKAASRAYSREFAQFDTENPSTPPIQTPTPTPKPIPTPKPPKPTPVDPPSGVALYKAGTTYKAGDKVAHIGHIYQCKPWPFTGWCSSTHEAYAPGTGGAWRNAWTKID